MQITRPVGHLTAEEAYAADVEHERLATARVKDAAQALAAAVLDYPTVWRWGDGYGGYVLSWFLTPLTEAGLKLRRDPGPKKEPTNPPVPWSLRYAVMERDGFRCQHCGIQKGLVMDHDLPQVRGGKNTLENLQTLCVPCNSEKGTKTDAEWLAWRAGLDV